MDKILILGGSGLVGTAIKKQMCDRYDVYSTYCHNNNDIAHNKYIKFDIDNDVINILNDVKPDIVVSCLRGDFKKQLIVHEKTAQYLKVNGGRLYFFSTTNVFDADLSRTHKENDRPQSCTDYGKYKIKCEEKLQGILGKNVMIIRIPQVWGKACPRINNLIKLNKDRKQLEVYPDLEVNTNTDIMIAKQLDYIISRNLKGIFHLAANGTIKYDELFMSIAKKLNLDNIEIKKTYDEKGCFALSSERTEEFPEEMKISNVDVINYVTSKGNMDY